MTFFKTYRKKYKNFKITNLKQVLGQKVQTLTKKVNQLKPEEKYSDLNVIAQTFGWTPTFSYVQNIFTPVSQGDSDANAYTGDEIYVKSLRMRGTFYNVGADANILRLVCVCVKQNMEGLITTTNIGNLVMESAYSSTANAVNAPLDHDNRHGVTILYDKKFYINSNGNATTPYAARVLNVNLKINKKIQFQNGGTVPTMNGLYWFFISDRAASGYLNYVQRINYTDV